MSDVLNIPHSWVQATVADLGKVVSGGTPSTKENSYWGGNISWISPSDLTGYSSKCISKGAKSITQEGLKKSSATIMPAGSIHFSSRAPIGYTVISSCNMTTNQGFKSLVPAQGVFNEYIYYYFKSAKQLAESKATGTTFKEISGTAFSKLPVPLPPTNEQHRIVAKIEELFSDLDKGIENLKTARAQLKVYRQALLKHAFEGKLTAQWRAENQDKLETAEALQKRIQLERTQCYQQQLADWEAAGKQGSKPKAPKSLLPLTPEELAVLPELPEGWGWFLMGGICLESILGKMLDKEKNKGELKPYLRNINVRWGKFALDNLLEMRFEESEYVRFGLKDGDLVICEGGEPGRCAVWRKELGQDMQIQKALHRVRFTNSINSSFVQMYFELCASNRRLEKMFTGTTIKHLTGEKLARMAIPICSIDEQAQILLALESKFSEVDQLHQTITTALQQAEALRQSILKKAFSGQLVAQDANDEPASALLARIQAEKSAQAAMAKPRKPQKTQAQPAPAKTNVIPFPAKIANISATDLHASILALAYQHHEQNSKYLAYFGHVKAEKIGHLVEAHLGIDLERVPVKDAAGPNDYPHLKKVESRARKANWFEVLQQNKDGAYVFSKKHGFDALLDRTANALGERIADVDALLKLLLPLNTRQAEIVATLYAAWNNLLLLGRSPQDEDVVYEARENWHESKLKIDREKFFKGLEWMRNQGLAPAGRGRYVSGKSKRKTIKRPT